MNREETKKKAGRAALRYLKTGAVIGVGTGSTVNHFIDALKHFKDSIKGAVSSSVSSTEKLEKIGIEILDCNDVEKLDLYIDGADEINLAKDMIKGGGAALTREKIVAAVSDKFICIVDSTKVVDTLGNFPLPIEVIPMARELVVRELRGLGGDPIYRENTTTDNGNIILDIQGMRISRPRELEVTINNIPGVVTNGLFANRGADICIIGTPEGVRIEE